MEWRKIVIMFITAAAVIAVMTVWSNALKDGTKVEVTATGGAKEVFLQNCAACHGYEGRGSTQAKGLRGRALDPEYIKKIIQTGNTVMPRFHFIHDPALTELTDYVHNMK